MLLFVCMVSLFLVCFVDCGGLLVCVDFILLCFGCVGCIRLCLCLIVFECLLWVGGLVFVNSVV